jgi:hypothetical protein
MLALMPNPAENVTNKTNSLQHLVIAAFQASPADPAFESRTCIEQQLYFSSGHSYDPHTPLPAFISNLKNTSIFK